MRMPRELFEFDKDPTVQTAADGLYAQHRAIYHRMQEDPVKSYWEGIQLGAPAAMAKDRQQSIQEELQITQQVIQDTVLANPDQAPEIVDAAVDVQAEIQEQDNDVFFTYRTMLEQYKDDNQLDLDDEQLEWVAERATYANIMATVFEQDWQGTAGDLLGYLVAPNLSLIARDVTDMGSWWSSARSMQQTNRSFRNLPVEQRLTTFMALVDQVKERTPNNLKAMEILTGIISDEEYENIAMYQMLDKVGVFGYALDVVTLGAGLGRRAANPLRLGKQLKDDITNARIAEEALRDPELGEILGIDQISAAAHMTPTSLAPELFDGAADSTRTQVAKNVAQQQDLFSRVEAEVLEEGIRPLVNKPAAEARVIRELGSELGQAATDIKVVNSSTRGMTLEYKVVNSMDGVESQTVFRPYTFDDTTGGFTHLQHKMRLPFIRWFTSPLTKFQEEYEALKAVTQRGMFQSGKWTKAFNSEMRRINNITSRDVREEVAKILEKGNIHKNPDDSVGRTFSVDELRGMHLTDEKGIQQYYEFRALMDQAWKYKNIEQGNIHSVAGHKLFQLGDDGPTPVKPYTSYASAKEALVNTNTHNIAVFRGPEMETMVGRMPDGTINPRLKEMMDEGMVLMRPQNSGRAYLKDDEGFNFVLGWDGELTNIVPGQTRMLAFHDGYLPIFYGPAGEANYFGQQVRHARIDGVHKAVRRDTKVYFATKTDAKKWAFDKNLQYFKAKEMDEAEALARIEKGEDLPFSWKHDREVEREQFDNWHAGGPYTGRRGEDRLVRGLGEEEAKFLDPITSMQRYLDNIANNLPLSAYRVGLEDKWMKHAKEVGAIPKDWFGTFPEARGQVEAATTVSLGFKVKRFLLDSHENITFNNRVPTMGEERVQGRFISMAERMETVPVLGQDGMKLNTYLHRLSQKDLPGSLRAVTFHFLLGLLSPAQYVIQGSGSAIAFAIDPVNAAKGLPYAMGFHALDLIADTKHRAAVLGRLEKSWPGLTERWNAWQRTGLHDSVISSSGDYRSMIGSHPIGVDLWTRASSTAGIAANKAAFPYKAGELLTRRISFATAIERHLAKGGKLDDDGVRQVMNIANDFMLNMDRTMKGDYQKGWWGVPTQFLQVHFKFIETLFNRQFTKWERSRLLGMQIAMYGGMGVPIPFLAQNVLNRFIDEDTPEEWITLANEGTVGFLFREMMGFDNELVSRVSIPYGITETFRNIFLENPGIWDVLPGASDSIPSRAVELGQAIHRIFVTSQWDTAEVDPVKVGILARDFAKFITTGRNAVEAYSLATLDTKHHRLGPALHTDEINIPTLIAQGVGFKHSESQDMFVIYKSKKKYEERVSQYVDMITEHLTNRFNVEGKRGSSGQYEDLEQLLNYLMSKEDNPAIHADVQAEILNRISKTETLVDKAMLELVDMQVRGVWDWAMSTRSLHRGDE